MSGSRSNASVRLTEHQRSIIHNSLNEYVNGLWLPEQERNGEHLRDATLLWNKIRLLPIANASSTVELSPAELHTFIRVLMIVSRELGTDGDPELLIRVGATEDEFLDLRTLIESAATA